MNKMTFDLVPDGYPFCIVTDCPVAEHCLRQKARQMLGKNDKVVKVVNPLLTQPSEQCEFYRSDEPQVFARGFAAMQEEMSVQSVYEEASGSFRTYRIF